MVYATETYALAQSGESQSRDKPVSKAHLMLLSFLFGGIGAHKFYLGKKWHGALYILFCWTGIPALLALIEFTVYAFTSTARLNQEYGGAKASFAVISVVSSIALAIVVGMLATKLQLPANATKRAKVAEGLLMALQLRTQITEAFLERRPDMSCEPNNCPIGMGLAGTDTLRCRDTLRERRCSISCSSAWPASFRHSSSCRC